MDIDCIIGMSLDGRMDWIVNPEIISEIYYSYVMKRQYDAVICGSSTMLQAHYDENVEMKYSNQTLVVVDSQGKIDNWEIIKKQAYWNEHPIVLCSENTLGDYLKYVKKCGITAIIQGKKKVDLIKSINTLSDYGINSMRVDSGGILLGQLIRCNIVKQIQVIISPQLTGGLTPKSIFVADDLSNDKGVKKLKLHNNTIIKDNYVLLEYEILAS